MEEDRLPHRRDAFILKLLELAARRSENVRAAARCTRTVA